MLLSTLFFQQLALDSSLYMWKPRETSFNCAISNQIEVLPLFPFLLAMWMNKGPHAKLTSSGEASMVRDHEQSHRKGLNINIHN